MPILGIIKERAADPFKFINRNSTDPIYVISTIGHCLYVGDLSDRICVVNLDISDEQFIYELNCSIEEMIFRNFNGILIIYSYSDIYEMLCHKFSGSISSIRNVEFSIFDNLTKLSDIMNVILITKRTVTWNGDKVSMDAGVVIEEQCDIIGYMTNAGIMICDRLFESYDEIFSRMLAQPYDSIY